VGFDTVSAVGRPKAELSAAHRRALLGAIRRRRHADAFLRETVIQLVRDGAAPTALAEESDGELSRQTVYNWLREHADREDATSDTE
jgi:hypothetical protein